MVKSSQSWHLLQQYPFYLSRFIELAISGEARVSTHIRNAPWVLPSGSDQIAKAHDHLPSHMLDVVEGSRELRKLSIEYNRNANVKGSATHRPWYGSGSYLSGSKREAVFDTAIRGLSGDILDTFLYSNRPRKKRLVMPLLNSGLSLITPASEAPQFGFIDRGMFIRPCLISCRETGKWFSNVKRERFVLLQTEDFFPADRCRGLYRTWALQMVQWHIGKCEGLATRHNHI